MARKKVTRVTRSDGTTEEIVEQKQGGARRVVAWVLGTSFVIAIAIRYPWMWAVYAGLLALAIYGGVQKRKEQNADSEG